MTTSRSNSKATTWLATSGLLAGASVLGSAVATSPADAILAQPSSCPSGTFLAATRTCELYATSSMTWNAPASVKTLQILTLGAGGGGGGGTTYAPGGGGGGGALRICTTSIVDLSHHINIVDGAGGAGGADGSAYLYDNAYGSEHGDPGSNGGATSVSAGSTLCHANGGLGGQTGYHYTTAGLPTTPIYGGGGNSGGGALGGSAAGLQVGNTVTPACIANLPWEYNIVASGGGGAAQGLAPANPVGPSSGAGGNGAGGTGPFSGATGSLGGGGGGGGGFDCHGRTFSGNGGDGGGGAGGHSIVPVTAGVTPHGAVTTAAVPGAANTGGGGGGGAGSDLATQTSLHGVGFPGAQGGSGLVLIRFAEPTVNANAYFDTASSTLSAADKTALNKFVTKAIADNMASVVVTGYTDPRGNAPYNKQLSIDRANSTANYLRKLFAAQHKTISITAVGKGETTASRNFALDRVATVVAQGGTLSGK